MRRAKQELRGIGKTIKNLQDNTTPANRKPTDRRLLELAEQWQQLERRLEALDRLSFTHTQISAIVSDAQEFMSSPESTLRQALPQENSCALRQGIERVLIDKAAQTATIRSTRRHSAERMRTPGPFEVEFMYCMNMRA